MKKMIFCVASMLPLAVAAQYVGPTLQAESVTVAKVLAEGADDQRVALQGKLVNKIEDEKYTLDDGTGRIVVKIDDKLFAGIRVDETNTVRIDGKVDKDLGKAAEVDADFLRLVR